MEFSMLTELKTHDLPWKTLDDGVVALRECAFMDPISDDNVDSRVPDWATLSAFGDFQTTPFHPWSVLPLNQRDLSGNVFAPFTFGSPDVVHWYRNVIDVLERVNE